MGTGCFSLVGVMKFTTCFHLVPSPAWMALSAVTAVCLRGMNRDHFTRYVSPSTFILQEAHNTKCTVIFFKVICFSPQASCLPIENGVRYAWGHRMQWCTHPGCQIAMENKFCIVPYSTYESVVWNLLRETLLVPGSLRWPLTYSMVQSPWEAMQLAKKFPAFHGTRRFITALTSVRHPSVPCASPIQSIYPHPISWRSILILSTHLCLGLSSGLFPSRSLTKNPYTPFSLTHTRHMPSPSHSSRFYPPHNIGWGVQIFNAALATENCRFMLNDD